MEKTKHIIIKTYEDEHVRVIFEPNPENTSKVMVECLEGCNSFYLETGHLPNDIYNLINVRDATPEEENYYKQLKTKHESDQI